MIGIYYLTTYNVQVKNINNHMLIQSDESYEISTKQTYSTSIKVPLTQIHNRMNWPGNIYLYVV